MALETATYISDLVSTNPASSDNISQGDDHLRLLKATLKATFPSITGAVSRTHTDINNLVTLAGTETLTNKTLTSPTVNTATLSGGTINNAAIGGTTPAAGAFTTLSATGDITSSGTGQIKVPVGTTAQRSASPSTGMIRYNSTLATYEGYYGSVWGAIGGAGAAKGGGTDDVFFENAQTVSTSYTITANKNAFSTGPITVASGVTVTVPSSSRWVIF